ncbi:phosphotransferase [Candidatus Laterigemmans baculatus]|uniref:phosphotransferase n=1 Tax=Candidatus Laterigemmans baculatus TaxID=2770505 RepID=UPI0013DB0B63|nr:phosphotransferase [Candidatus Laterigemmans baculatus]
MVLLDSLPAPVFDAWLRSRGVTGAARIGGGLSGADIYRARRGTAALSPLAEPLPQWAVRGWPPAVSAERVAEVHRVMRQARRLGCQWTPAVEPLDAAASAAVAGAEEPRTWLVAAGRVWDCCQWMPGQPWSFSEVAGAEELVEVLRQIAAAVAQFHAAVRPLSEPVPMGPISSELLPSRSLAGGLVRGAVPAVAARLQRLQELERLLEPLLGPGVDPRAVSHRLFVPGSPLERARECLRQAWGAERQRAVRLLRPWERVVIRQQYVFRDIHLGNVLLNEKRLSGIVDYDAVRIDTPATDLARLVSSVRLALPPDEWPRCEERLWSEMLAAYRAAGEFSAEEEQLARVLAEVSPLISLANWLVWVAVEGRSFAGPAEAVTARLEGWMRIMRQQMAAGLGNSTGIETR